MLKLHRCFLH